MNLKPLLGYVLLGLTAALAAAGDAPSPARTQMEGFLAAFNSGERATIEAFGREHAPPDFVRPAVLDDTMKMFAANGGLDLVSVDESGPLAVKARVRERKTGAIARLSVQVNPAEPTRITVIQLLTADSLDGK